MSDTPDKQLSPSFYSVIPAYVLYDKTLNPNAKLLFASLTGLAKKEGYAYASNNYLGDLYGVDRSSITRWIKDLSDRGYISVEYIYEDGKPNIKERRIYIAQEIKIEPSKPEKEDKPLPVEATDGGGGVNMHQGGAGMHQGGGADMHQGGANLQEILLISNKINSSSSSTDPPKAEKPPPEEEELSKYQELRQYLKNLDQKFVFSDDFYKRALNFMAGFGLSFEYASFVYKFCKDRSSKNIDGYFFTVFFESRCVELFREESTVLQHDLPALFFCCPVCGNDHDVDDFECPRCNFRKDALEDQKRIHQAKVLFEMSTETSNAYFAEQSVILKDGFTDDTKKKFEELDRKYGLFSE